MGKNNQKQNTKAKIQEPKSKNQEAKIQEPKIQALETKSISISVNHELNNNLCKAGLVRGVPSSARVIRSGGPREDQDGLSILHKPHHLVAFCSGNPYKISSGGQRMQRQLPGQQHSPRSFGG